jgi:hypothetical protein
MSAYSFGMGTRCRRLVAAALLALVAAAMMPVLPVSAGTPADHPEFPYPETAYDEAFRGQFHFSSRGGWLNDPNGSFFYRGQYHLFWVRR